MPHTHLAIRATQACLKGADAPSPCLSLRASECVREREPALDWLAGPGPGRSSFGIDELRGAEGIDTSGH